MEKPDENRRGQLNPAKVIPLDEYEKRLVAASFLATISSGLFIFFLLAFPLLVTVGSLTPLTDESIPLVVFVILSLTGFGIAAGILLLFLWWWSRTVTEVWRRTTFLLLSAVSLLTNPVALPFLWWSCAVTYMWRRTILLISSAVSLAIFIFALAQTITVSNDFVKDAGLGPTTPYGPVIMAFAILFAIGVSLPILFFGWGILSDGWRLAGVEEHERPLFSSQGTLAATFGIHPVCHWIPLSFRLVIVDSLFCIAACTVGATVVLVIIALVRGGLFPALIFSGIGAAITGALRYFAALNARTSAETLIRVDPRLPVLFLRSFQEDQVKVPRSKKGFIRGLIGIGEPSPTIDSILVEEATPLGPVIALGVPGSRPPFAAARTYVDHTEWQNAVAEFAKKARAIVVVLDETEGVRWELAHIDSSGYLPKALYLLPPRFAARTEGAARVMRHELFERKCALRERLTAPCIGWYQTAAGEIVLLTSRRPSKASYVCALRLFRENQTHGYVPEPTPPRPITPGTSTWTQLP